MLARLQKATTLGLLLAAVVWAAWFVAAGAAALAVVGALAIVLAYSLFLAIEFVMLRLAHGDDPAPRATPAELLRAWWGEVTTAPRVFCWRQPFRSDAEPDHLPGDAMGRRGVLLVHGFICNRGLWNPWMARLRSAQVPFVAVNLEPVFGSIDDYVAIIDQAVRRLQSATGQAPIVVAHSMGGLATRAWLGLAGNSSRVHHIFTLGTPHHGTWLARFSLTANGHQMRQGNPWLQHIGRHEVSQPAAGAAHNPYARFTCFYSHCDNIVFPPSTATLPGADNRHVPGTAHVHMAYQGSVFNEVLRWVAPPTGVPGSAPAMP